MEKRLLSWVWRKRGRGSTELPVPAVTGPLLGLGYILVMPFIGILASIVLCGVRVSRAATYSLR